MVDEVEDRLPWQSFYSVVRLTCRCGMSFYRRLSTLIRLPRTIFGQRRWSSGQTVPSNNLRCQDKTQAKLLLGFSCNVCNTRTHRTISKLAYSQGVVLAECPGCKNRHLIADHLGWFDQGQARTVEDFVKSKGESIRYTMTEDEYGIIREMLPSTQDGL